ncbi:MAG: hypothetical protein GY888_24065, partial [Planctomycetaceae bacterium]|nr:hypothetical protein [Planctomycetaceae bacterium]
MTVAVLVITDSDVAPLISWGARFARKADNDLLVLQVQRQRSQSEIVDVPLAAESSGTASSLVQDVLDEIGNLPFPLQFDVDLGSDTELHARAGSTVDDREVPLRARMKRIASSQLIDAILQELVDQDVKLLIIPRHAPLQGIDAGGTLERQLFLRAPCETMYLRAGNVAAERCDKILVPTAGGPHGEVALTR